MDNKRFWEIDFLRGFAIVMMVVYHFVYDINFFNISEINIASGFWWYVARITASLFILLVGVSLTLSYNKYGSHDFKKFLKRGLYIFSLGMLITFATWLFIRDGFIIFGVLHMIGISTILGYFFVKERVKNLILGLAVIFAGLYLQTLSFDFSWLMWLGFVPSDLYTVDYFPLLPWFGLVLIGIYIGNTFYADHKRRFTIPFVHNDFTDLLSFLGRNSLFIYLTHQILLVGMIYLILAF